MHYISMIVKIILLLAVLMICTAENDILAQRSGSDEIIYHLFQRSFYDSNGDLHGDLNGLREKLPYLQELGITSILLLPLYESVYYHNYFPISFRNIDPEYGTEEDYLKLVREIHSRGMKLYMDMEVHYVTEDHLWYADSYKNPESIYSEYLIYNGPENTEPLSIIYDLHSLKGYDGSESRITTLNLNNRDVIRALYDEFAYWVDPNGDGDYTDGVDGFRIDHMMDDLDYKGLFTNMLSDFWKPLFEKLRAINPDIRIIGEQANWADYAVEYYTEADIDWMFSFGTFFAISQLDKEQIIHQFDTTFKVTPPGKNRIIFIENHDTHRFAEVVSTPDLLKIGAALNLLLPGIPSIYYGQELGMTGRADKYPTVGDANHIPVREAFEWYADVEGKGMCLWYKDSGPWWDESNLKSFDGISYEEQVDDPSSLWNTYRSLIALRKEHEAFRSGELTFVPADDPDILAFKRHTQDDTFLIVLNLGAGIESPILASAGSTSVQSGQKEVVLSIPEVGFRSVDQDLTLPPYGIQVFKLTD